MTDKAAREAALKMVEAIDLIRIRMQGLLPEGSREAMSRDVSQLLAEAKVILNSSLGSN